MHYYKFISVVTFCFLFSLGFASQKTDSLLVILKNSRDSEKGKILILLSKEYLSENPDKSMFYAQEANNNALKYRDQSIEISALNCIGDAYIYLNDFNLSDKYYNEALTLSIKYNDTILKANTYINLGYLSYITNDYATAEIFFKKAYFLYNTASDFDGEANALNNIGLVLLQKGDIVLAEKYFVKSLQNKIKSNNIKDMCLSLSNLGVLFKDKSQFDKAEYYFIHAYNLSKSINDPMLKADLLNNLGLIQHSKGDLNKALQTLDVSKRLYESIGYKNGIHKVYNNIGLVYFDMSVYNNAIIYFQKAINIVDAENQADEKASILLNIGNVFVKISQYNKALEYFEEAIASFKKTDNYEGISTAYVSIANVYSNIGSFNNSIEYYNRSLEIKKMINDMDGISNIYQNIGALYEFKEINYQKAIQYYQESLKIKKEANNYKGMAITLQTIGNIYKNIKENNLALKYINESNDIAKRINARDIMAINYKYISEVLYNKGDLNNSIDYLFQYITLNDSIKNNDINKQINEIITRYETEKKEQQINLLETEKELKESQLQQQSLLIYLILFALLLISLILILIFRQYKSKKQANIELSRMNHTILNQNTEITDSIEYANKILTAALSTEEDLIKYFTQSFILFKPRDVVSGDFLWVYEKENKIVVAVADCTGHGVPGALMSILGNQILKETLKDINQLSSGLILFELRSRLINTLNPKNKSIKTKDGMDIALCVFERNQNGEISDVQYSGAFNPIYIIRDNELIEYKADRKPIGLYYEDTDNYFKEQNISLRENDIIYMFSDGYMDQFGGDRGKKLKSQSFRKILMECSSQDISKQKAFLEIRHNEWKANHSQTDDIIVVCIKI